MNATCWKFVHKSRLPAALLVALICVASSGCTLSRNLLQTTIIQPNQYCEASDLSRQKRCFRKMAACALDQARATARAESDFSDCPPLSIDTEDGFQEGFVDYLIYGGTGTTPPLPPRRYWRLGYQNPMGQIAMQDWYKGYQIGAATAQASGYRENITVVTSDELIKDTTPVYWGQLLDSSLNQVPTEPAATSGNLPVAKIPEKWLSPAMVPRQPSIQEEFGNEPALGEENYFEPQANELRLVGKTAPETRINNRPFVDVGSLPPPDQLIFERATDQEALSSAFRAAYESLELPSRDVSQTADEQLPPQSHKSESADGEIQLLLPIKNLPPLSSLNTLDGVTDVNPLKRSKRNGSNNWQVDDRGWIMMAGLFQPADDLSTLPRQIEPKSNDENAKPGELEEHSLVNATSNLGGYDTVFLTPTASNALLIMGTLLLVALFWVVVVIMIRQRWNLLWGKLGWKIVSLSFAKRQSAVSANRLSDSLPPLHKKASTNVRIAAVLGLVCLSSGCAALSNPVQHGIPVRRLPTDLLTTARRENLQTVPLSLLQQKKPADYILGPGDVIGVFIPGVFPLTLADQALPAPPVYFPSQIDPLGAGLPPSLGYPIEIQNNGMLSLPLVEPVPVSGLTIEQANARIRDAYESKAILQAGREAVVITLMQPRQVRVVVFRQEVGGFAAGGRGDISSNNVKQGTGHIVNLRAYENDVLSAMAKTGGLPGLDSFDGIYVFRGGQSNAALTEKISALDSAGDVAELSQFGVETDYIPTRWHPDEPLPFKPEDILLNEGDVVLVESRAKDFYYTGGLLPVGEQVLPRDYDLDVLEAVAQVRGTLVNGAFGGNNFTGVLIQTGIGNPNPSNLTVIRKMPGGGQIPIRVDLNRALVDPRERILVQPDDLLILQETSGETFARYLKDIFGFNLTIFQRPSSGTVGVTN